MMLGVPILLCMDLQMEFVAPGRPWADPDGEAVAARCAEMIELARESGWTLVHAQLHPGGPMMAGDGLPQPIPGCEPRPGEVLLRRAGVSAYAHPDMAGILEGAMGAPSFMIGFSAPMSLTSTLLDAEERGHGLALIDDTVGAADVGEWGAEHTRALCLDTAERLSRLVHRSEIDQAAARPLVAALPA